MTREEILKLKTLDDNSFVELFQRLLALEKRVKELEEENALLRARLNMNSTNSSMPPSSDGFKKKSKTKSLRVKSNKSSGGQLGHKGHTLEKVATPDKVVEIAHEVCPHCSSNIENTEVDEIKTRQIFDIPPIKINVTEYRVHSKTCPHCRKKSSSEFPADVTQPTAYGPNIQALILNLNVYQCIPYKRLKEFLSDVFKVELSQGTIYNVLKRAYKALEGVEKIFIQELQKSEILHADESGVRVGGKLNWFHSYSNDKITMYFSHLNRGKKAITDNGILSDFKGILVHDCWYAYDTFNHFLHSLCCAHFMRELNYLEENTELKFPKEIKETFIEMISMLENQNEISELLHNELYFKYIFQVQKGLIEEKNMFPFDHTAEIGKKKRRRSKAYNLLKRLERYDDVLRFFLEKNTAIFTNNLAERDIRNIKVKGKISGCFRSQNGSKFYSRTRGYISTVKKNGLNQFEALKSIFELSEIIIPIMS